MNIKPQKTEELTKLAELIKDMKYAMLSSYQVAEGKLTSRPMTPQEMCEEGAIWFLADSDSESVRNLEVMNLAFSNESENTYISIAGHGELVADRQRMQTLWSMFARPWFPQGVESKNLTLLKFVPHSAEFWDGPDSKVVQLLTMAASIAAAKPIGMGEHGQLSL
ncbi:MAG TPA: pyridoxamine 5'-phosphate oxidase family protein [Methylophilus sp.]